MTTTPKEIRRGRGLVGALDAEWFAESLVFASEAAFLRVKAQFARPPRDVVKPLGPEYMLLDAQVRSLPEAPVVFGLGGGAALDAAKYYANEHGARLVLVPGAVSSGAAFRSDVLVRDGGVPLWVDGAAADLLLCDFESLESAPTPLMRAGLGEFVALGVECELWRNRRDRPKEGLDALNALLDAFFGNAARFAVWNEASVATLLDAYIEISAVFERFAQAPNSSEVGRFANALQGPKGKGMLWGECLIWAALAAAVAQGLPLGPTLAFLNAAGGLPELALTEEEWLAAVERFAALPTEAGERRSVLQAQPQRLRETYANLRRLLF